MGARRLLAMIALLVAFAAYYVGIQLLKGPALLREKLRFAREPKRVRLAETELPPKLAAAFAPAVASLAEQGCRLVGFQRMDAVSGTHSFAAGLVHDASRAGIILGAIVTPEVTKLGVLVFSRLLDGGRVTTSNFGNPSLWPKVPTNRGYRLSQMTSPTDLLEAHLALVDAFRGERPIASLADEDPFEDDVRSALAAHERQLTSGLLEPHVDGVSLRLTERGARYAAWRLAQPIAQLRAMSENFWSRRALAAARRRAMTPRTYRSG